MRQLIRINVLLLSDSGFNPYSTGGTVDSTPGFAIDDGRYPRLSPTLLLLSVCRILGKSKEIAPSVVQQAEDPVSDSITISQN